MKKFAVVGAVMLTAFLSLAWIKGGAQPMQWIEQPVDRASAPGAGQ